MTKNDDLVSELECPHCGKETDLGGEYNIIFVKKDSVGDEYGVDERPTQVTCENCGDSFWIVHKIRD